MAKKDTKVCLKPYENSTFWHVYDGKSKTMRIKFGYIGKNLKISRFNDTRNLKMKEVILKDKQYRAYLSKTVEQKIVLLFHLLYE